MSDEERRAREWLHHTYGDRVVLSDVEPVFSGDRAVFFSCRYHDNPEPMLAATLCVPRDGSDPFPTANGDPLDEDFNLSGEQDAARWRLNARNCVVAADAVLNGHAASALPWQPDDEEPGWWERMLAAHFPGAETTTCTEWEQAAKTIGEGGPGTRGIVWLRRQLDGHDLTGHLLFAEYGDEGVVFLDAQRGVYADIDDPTADELLVARFTGATRDEAPSVAMPWDMAAEDFPAAVRKAEHWLAGTYADAVQLAGPAPEDELSRGWLFAITTERFTETGDWRDQMLDAALVVPKAPGQAPFGLPNRDPWGWLDDWEAGVPGLSGPPPPGEAAWFAPAMAQLGEAEEIQAHANWVDALEWMSGFPSGTRVLIWVRRKDDRGRETVGHLLWAVPDDEGVRLVDPMADDGEPLIDPDPFELRMIRIAASTPPTAESEPSPGTARAGAPATSPSAPEGGFWQDDAF
ncbi:YrhB domain-containing protein [Amycolatopsis sp. NPDC059021]|uniref:YrhB domain-containing protein n=1 Tax=Amycolatopsis sp. NPDC059021 TaxID=3346704 RepID=UPI0036708616